jgi:hypothetical protein
MDGLRLGAIGFVLMTGYYARFFFGVRQEGATLVQIAILLVAAGVLLLPQRSVPRLGLKAWMIGVAALALAVGIVAWADQDSNSMSDTLTRAVPALCLILALAVRLMPEPDAARG